MIAANSSPDVAGDDGGQPPGHADHLLVVDTCSLLDVVRLPTSRRPIVADVGSVRRLLELATDGSSRLTILVCDVVDNEFTHNLDKVKQVARDELSALHRTFIQMSALSVSLLGEAILTTPTGWYERLLDEAAALALQVVAAGTHVTCSRTAHNNAFTRVMERRPPAKAGSASQFDSLICEVALELARERPKRTTALLTSNTRDYCDGVTLHPLLAREFDSAGLLFATSWAHAAGLLGAF